MPQVAGQKSCPSFVSSTKNCERTINDTAIARSLFPRWWASSKPLHPKGLKRNLTNFGNFAWQAGFAVFSASAVILGKT
jgi:hypothetical protein